MDNSNNNNLPFFPSLLFLLYSSNPPPPLLPAVFFYIPLTPATPPALSPLPLDPLQNINTTKNKSSNPSPRFYSGTRYLNM